MNSASYTLSPATSNDGEFLYELGRITMHDYVVAIWGEWYEKWQRDRFDTNFQPSEWTLVMIGGERAGGFAVEHRPDSLYVSRLYLLPEYQRQGIGADIIRRLQSEASRRHVPVTLNVLRSNRLALQFYKRHGFHLTHEDDKCFHLSSAAQ